MTVNKDLEEFDEITRGFILGALLILSLIPNLKTHLEIRERLFNKTKELSKENNIELKGCIGRAYLTINKIDIDKMGL